MPTIYTIPPTPTTVIQSIGMTITTATNSCSTLYICDGQMFIPLGNGSLYYHGIPSALTTTATTNWTTSACTPFYWQAETPSPAPGWRPFPRRALQRPALIAGRRALRRSIELFCKLRPEEEIRQFLSGKPLIAHGQRFDYEMQKRDNVLHHTMHPYGGHIPYRLALLAKSGKLLATGCIVIPNTPVIDQLLALILHVQDPDEELVVLRRTNWTPRIDSLLRDELPMAA
jgi:hypothetical protein